MTKEEYLNIFNPTDYPDFLDKYLETATMKRLLHVTQFCGCDYPKLYQPAFLYTRYFHSLIVAYMTWHFSKNKKETIAALLHDIGTPCFAHTIDYVYGDYINQESSEKSLTEMCKRDPLIIEYLEKDGMTPQDLENLSKYHILENNSPRLCTDRLDGALHTETVWLNKGKPDELKAIYDDITILRNEDGLKEIGFQTLEKAELFFSYVGDYAIELQSNKVKFYMHYISAIIKAAIEKGIITIEMLYTYKEEDIVEILKNNFSSWEQFTEVSEIIETDNFEEASQWFNVTGPTKNRMINPLVNINGIPVRIENTNTYEVQKVLRKIKGNIVPTYAYVKGIKYPK